MVSTLEWSGTRESITGGRAAIYVRVSSGRQEQGASLDVQLEACRQYCEKVGLDIVGEFRDIQSGLDIDRPQYQQALSLAKVKGFDQLVVWRYDRSGRDDAEYATMLRDFAKLGIQLVSSSGESPDPLFQKLAGVLAWDESRRISVRSTSSKMKRFEDGYWPCKAPFGYDTQKQPEGGSILVPKDGEAELVQELFERYASGRESIRDVQRWLNAEPIITKPRSRRGINHILASRVYLGEVPHGQHVDSQFHPKPDGISWRKGKHGALVTADVFDQAQAILHQNKRSYGKGSQGRGAPSRGGPNARYLFAGLLFCGVCGRRYVATPGGPKSNYPIYRCGARHSNLPCASRGISESKLTPVTIVPIEKLLRQLSDQDVKQTVREEILRQQDTQHQAITAGNQDVVKQLERIEARLSKLEDTYLDGDITRERYRVRRDELTQQAQVFNQRIQDSPKPVSVDVDSLLSLADSISIDNLDTQAWRMIVSEMVGKITIETENGKSRAVVTWKPEYAMLVNEL